MAGVVHTNNEIFTISEFCTNQECDKWIAQSESLGYEEATVNSEHGPRRMPDVRNNARVIVDDPSLAGNSGNVWLARSAIA